LRVVIAAPDGDEANASSVAYVGAFEQKASHAAYFPHITIGAGTLDAGEPSAVLASCRQH
jgi:hypothetical protein